MSEQPDQQACAHVKAKTPSDQGICRARGGTRTGFQALGTLGSGVHMRNPGQSGGCTRQSKAGSVDIVHTSFLPRSGHARGQSWALKHQVPSSRSPHFISSMGCQSRSHMTPKRLPECLIEPAVPDKPTNCSATGLGTSPSELAELCLLRMHRAAMGSQGSSRYQPQKYETGNKPPFSRL